MSNKSSIDKRIILAVTNDLTSDQRVHRICTSLKKHGFDLMLVGRSLPSSSPLRDRGYLSKRFRLHFNKGPLFYLEFNLKLFFLLKTEYADILVANDLDTLPAVYFASKIKKIPFVYDSHEYFTEVPELTNRRCVRWIWLTIERLMIRESAKSYTVCDSIAEIYNKKYKLEMAVVRNLPQTPTSTFLNLPIHLPVGKKIIIYQGAVNLGRGIEQVIHAMEFVDNAIFLIVGMGDIYDELRILTQEKGLNNKVTFLGQIPFEDLPHYTSHAQLGVSLEQNMGLSYYYSLPNKLFDYIAAGVPILASPFPEVKKIVEEYGVGLLTENYEPKHLADMINFMLNDTDSRDYWKKNLQNASKQLNWENEESRLLTVYNSIK